MVLNSSLRHNFKPIDQLAATFIEKKLGFTQGNLNRFSRVISEKLLRYSHEYGCLDESKTELQRILQNLDPSVGSRIARLHSRILEQHLAEAQPHQQPNKETMTNDDN